MSTKYISYVKVLSVYEETTSRHVPDPNGGRDPDTGRMKYIEERTGTGRWFYRTDGSSALHIGGTKPDFDVGDFVEITTRKVRPDEVRKA